MLEIDFPSVQQKKSRGFKITRTPLNSQRNDV